MNRLLGDPCLLVKALLRGPCSPTNARLQRFPPGHATDDEVIVSHRLIWVRDGRLVYTIDGVKRVLVAGSWLWVPSWSRRHWRTGKAGCELCWVEFTSDPVEAPPGWHLLEIGAGDEDVANRHVWMASNWPAPDELSRLRYEAEIKALAAIFWGRAKTRATIFQGEKKRHPEVAHAVAWLETHFSRTTALDDFYAALKMSPNHFRMLYRRETGETVQATLARLRLRRARYLVSESALSIKEIAAECGFDDPLYFSVHYRRFWGSPPSSDRGGGAAA